ncbi:hypothetical protein J6590_028759, partial [Homalodisca vitripennis]
MPEGKDAMWRLMQFSRSRTIDHLAEPKKHSGVPLSLCARWIDCRSTTEEIIGTRLSPSSLVAYMIKKEENWSAVEAYAQRLLKAKIAERD